MKLNFFELPKNRSVMSPLGNATGFLELLESQNAFIAAVAVFACLVAFGAIFFIVGCMGRVNQADNNNNNTLQV